MTADISIVVPVRDRGPLAVATLDSIAAQTLPPAQLIVVDNGSTPSTRALIEAWTATHTGLNAELVHEPLPGAARARNAGLARSAARWTMFFDSDDIMAPSHVEAAWRAAVDSPDAEIVGWDTVFVDETGRELRSKIFPKEHILYNAVMHGSLATQCYMARTVLFRRAGGWNDDTSVWDDMELSARLLMLRPAIVKTDEPRTAVRILTHGESITGLDYSSRAEAARRTIRILRDTCQTASWGATAEGRELLPILALKQAILAACCRREGSVEIAHSLLREALSYPLTAMQRLALRGAYAYTVLDLRGAARIVRPMFC